MADIYANDPRRGTAATNYTTAGTRVESVNAPLDRVRWASVLAGLATVLATLVVMTVLGLALGLATLDADNPEGFAIGASIYSAVSALLAFGLGGFIAARTAAVAGTGNGILNGAMVWIVTIPLLVNVLGNGISSILGTAVDLGQTAVETGAQVAAPLIEEAAPAVIAEATAEATPGGPIDQAQQGAQNAVEDVQQTLENVDSDDVEETSRDLSSIAWGTLLALGLSAGASILGGVAGTRNYPTEIAINDRDNKR
ncbi:MAG: hypothetical protein SF029_21180 [bacterium]|nr:hypothetical protein [bacterium]